MRSLLADNIIEMARRSRFFERWFICRKITIIALTVLAMMFIRLDYVTGFTTTTSSPMTQRHPRQRALSGRVNAKVSRRDHVLLQETSTNKDSRPENLPRKAKNLPKKAVKIYADYATRLWTETNIDARRRIAMDKTTSAVKNVEQIMKGEEYVAFSEESEMAREQLLNACQAMLKVMEKGQTNVTDDMNGESQESTEKELVAKNASGAVESADSASIAKNASRSVLFGAVMGAVVACWVFSGNYVFTGIFTLMTILGQLEYYRMVMNTGIYPARRISVVGACSMFLTALFAPHLHEICLPLFGLWTMIWFLTMRRQVSTISEIATTFTGMFYLGYIPSFWVRIRLLGAGREPTRLAPIMGPFLKMIGKQAEALPNFIPQAIHLPITTGAVFIFWTWLCLAFNDVGAYFVGRKFGKTKLGTIAPAAGATSPNKSVEGVVGGCAVAAVLGIAGAWVQKWPYWVLTGAVHGALLGLIGLIGDLTASMLKRNAGLKDFGDLIPEHGGILDRVDSFIFTAPYSWLVCAYIVPALKRAVRARTALPV